MDRKSRAAVLGARAELAAPFPRQTVQSQFSCRTVLRIHREQLGSPLSNGGTSFPTPPNKAWAWWQCGWLNFVHVYCFQLLMGFDHMYRASRRTITLAV